MKIAIPAPKIGDMYLLFHHLPYDFSDELPLPLGPTVCLDQTPQDLLDRSENGLADFLLPGYSLPGRGLNHTCLRFFADLIEPQELPQKDFLFLSLLALRLYTPVEIDIGGQFRLGNENDPIQEPELYQIKSPWNDDRLEYLTPPAVEESSALMERLIEVNRLNLSRLQTALVFFSQVTLGFSKSFQLSYLGLFAALEALFVPPSNKMAVTLSQRISTFLADFQFPEKMDEWIKTQYIKGRHKLAHGIYDAAFGTKLRNDRYQAFGRLHEITRLSLLGFLSLNNDKLENISKIKGNALQKELDGLGLASGEFIENQRIWAS